MSFITSKKELYEKGWRQNPDGTFSKGVAPVDAIPAIIPEQPPLCSLDKGVEKRKRCSTCLARISLISHRRRLLGEDSVIYSCKAIRDIIAQDLLGGTIGQRDDDPAIAWEYGQVLTKGSEGVMVKIEIL